MQSPATSRKVLTPEAAALENAWPSAEQSIQATPSESDFLACLIRCPHWAEQAFADVQVENLNHLPARAVYTEMRAHFWMAKENRWIVRFDAETLLQAATYRGRAQRFSEATAKDRRPCEYVRLLEARAAAIIDPAALMPQAIFVLRQFAMRRDMFRLACQLQRATIQANDNCHLVAGDVQEAVAGIVGRYHSGMAIEKLDGAGIVDDEHSRGAPIPHMPLLTHVTNGLVGGTFGILVSRSGHSKSMFMHMLAATMAMPRSNPSPIPVLLLDAEMSRARVRHRMIAGMTGIMERWVRKKIYERDPSMVADIEEARQEIRQSHLYYQKVESGNFEQAIQLIRMWHRCVVEPHPTKFGLVIYDQIKGTGDTRDAKEWQIIGNAANSFKKLADELVIPIFSVIQANRAMLSMSHRDIADQGARVVGVSDRVYHESDLVLLQRRLQTDEQQVVREKYGERPDMAGSEVPEEKLQFNHVLHLIKNRDDVGFSSGIPLYYRPTIAHYLEMGVRRDPQGNVIVNPHGSPEYSDELRWLTEYPFDKKSSKVKGQVSIPG